MHAKSRDEAQLKLEQIATRAYRLWEQEGRHHHRDLEYWLEGEAKMGAALTGSGWDWLRSDLAVEERPETGSKSQESQVPQP